MKPLSAKARLLARLRDRSGEDSKENQDPVLAPIRHKSSPLTPMQQGMYFVDKLYPGGAEFNRPLAVEIRGKLQPKKLVDAFNRIVSRHRNLRSYVKRENGEIQQVYADQLKVSIEIKRMSGPDIEAKLLGECINRAHDIIDLEQLPLFRPIIFQLSPERHLLLIIFHHFIFDATSAQIFIKELFALYHDQKLDDLELQWGDFAYWWENYKDGSRIEEQVQYWRKKLLPDLPQIELPSKPDALSGYRPVSGSVNFRIAQKTVVRIQRLVEDQQVTPFVFLLSMLKVLMFIYVGKKDLVVGTAVSGRNNSLIEPLIGVFINNLSIRTQLNIEEPFTHLLQQVRSTLLEAMDHQSVPAKMLVEKLDLTNVEDLNPLFKVDLDFRSGPLKLNSTEISLHEYRFDHLRNSNPLSLRVEDGEEYWTFNWVYQTAKFAIPLIEQLARHTINLIDILLNDPQIRIKEIDILSKDERAMILHSWNDTDQDYSTQPTTVHQLVLAQADRTPDNPAVIFNNSAMSYQQLVDRSIAMAHHLDYQGIKQGDFVGICLNRTFDMTISLMALLQCGAIMVPIESDYPKSRIDYILQDAEISALITESELSNLFDENTKLILADELDLKNSNADLDLPPVHGESLCYIIYTSGSTGKPKGVMIEHGALVNHLLHRRKLFEFSHDDRILQLSPLSFDVSMWEIFYPLSTGAAVVLPESGREMEVSYLIDLMESERVSYLNPTPALLDVLLDHLSRSGHNALKHVIVTGEELPVDLMQKALTTLNTELTNAYGPTEGTIAQLYWPCNALWQQAPVPIGKPIDNMQAYVLNEGFQPVPIGVIGELYLGGAGLARGYLNKPEQTSSAFLNIPQLNHGNTLYKTGDLATYLSDGTIIFHGRADTQVSIRGLRIELGEIEHRLKSYTGVGTAVVSAVGDSNIEKYLVAYIVPEQDLKPLDESLIQKHLEQWLPSYMVPNVFLFLDELPINHNGKIDRKNLPVPNWEDREQYQPPVTRNEQLVAELWQKILNQPAIGREANFFQRGGDSIKAMRMLARIGQMDKRLSISIRQLFDHPTLREFSELLD